MFCSSANWGVFAVVVFVVVVFVVVFSVWVFVWPRQWVQSRGRIGCRVAAIEMVSWSGDGSAFGVFLPVSAFRV